LMVMESPGKAMDFFLNIGMHPAYRIGLTHTTLDLFLQI
jgi:hypothetical protein